MGRVVSPPITVVERASSIEGEAVPLRHSGSPNTLLSQVLIERCGGSEGDTVADNSRPFLSAISTRQSEEHGSTIWSNCESMPMAHTRTGYARRRESSADVEGGARRA